MDFTSNLVYRDLSSNVKDIFTKPLSAIPLGDAHTEEGEINYEYITGQYSPMNNFIESQYVNNTRSTCLNMSGYVELAPIRDLAFTSRVNGTLSHSRHGQYWGKKHNANRPSCADSSHTFIINNNAWNCTRENILARNTIIAKDHNLGGSLIISWNKDQPGSNMATVNDQVVDQWSSWRLTSGTSQRVGSDFI